MSKNRKQRTELILPGASSWECWSGLEMEPLVMESELGANEVTFGREAQNRILALPATQVWALPAWLKGAPEHLREMALLHLERLGVRVDDAAESMQARVVTAHDESHLCCILALKAQPFAWSDERRLPGYAVVSADCYPLPSDSIIIWRELGRLVLAITCGSVLVYCSPLSANRMDEMALSEVNNICLQLGFQRVLGRVSDLVLWVEDGDLAQVRRLTGLDARRESMPQPVVPAATPLMPAELVSARHRQNVRAQQRMLGLAAGALAAVAIFTVVGLTTMAVRERTMLRDKVAELMPRAARVQDHQRSWEEVASAVDPGRFPMELLLRCMEPKSAPEVTLTHFEAEGTKLILRGRTELPATALQYAQEIKEAESLVAYAWETPPPAMAADNSATFELKGERQ